MEVPPVTAIGTTREVAILFSQPMNPASINSSTMIVPGMVGTVTYDATNMIGAFRPSSAFAPNAAFTGSVTTGATGISGTPLSAAFPFFLQRVPPQILLYRPLPP